MNLSHLDQKSSARSKPEDLSTTLAGLPQKDLERAKPETKA